MVVFQSRFQRAFERSRSIREMAGVSVLAIIAGILTALILAWLPEAIDQELKLMSTPAPLLTSDQVSALTHKIIVADYQALKKSQAAKQ